MLKRALRCSRREWSTEWKQAMCGWKECYDQSQLHKRRRIHFCATQDRAGRTTVGTKHAPRGSAPSARADLVQDACLPTEWWDSVVLRRLEAALLVVPRRQAHGRGVQGPTHILRGQSTIRFLLSDPVPVKLIERI